MKIRKISDHIVLCLAKNQFELNDSFVRVSEFFESPSDEIHQKFFTMKKFKKVYAKSNGGTYTYNKDWMGHNIQSWMLDKFFHLFPPHTLRSFEKKLHDFLYKNMDFSKKFCLIAFVENDSGTLDHEYSHAMFHINDDYKEEMENYIFYIKKTYPAVYRKIKKKLKEWGYNDLAIEDEMHAYLSTNTIYKTMTDFKLIITDINWNLIAEMQSTFNRYMKEMTDGNGKTD